MSEDYHVAGDSDFGFRISEFPPEISQDIHGTKEKPELKTQNLKLNTPARGVESPGVYPSGGRPGRQLLDSAGFARVARVADRGALGE
jgi:hypothetical protein